MQDDDAKTALGQISGKDVQHWLRRFFQHNGGIREWGWKPVGKSLSRLDVNGIE
jgi:hypothetical protein